MTSLVTIEIPVFSDVTFLGPPKKIVVPKMTVMAQQESEYSSLV